MNLPSLRFAPLALVALVALGGAFAACSTPSAAVIPCDDPGPILIRGKDSGLEFCTGGAVHRTRVEVCERFEHPAGKCDPTGQSPQVSQCHSNADCGTPGEGLVCFDPGGDLACNCIASCTTDLDCQSDELCQCGEPFSQCRKALCRTDADCEAGRLCMDSEIDECGARGFACQSERDECLTSFDCPEQIPCIYIKDHRICSTKGCGT
jgi:hypothetical protein